MIIARAESGACAVRSLPAERSHLRAGTARVFDRFASHSERLMRLCASAGAQILRRHAAAGQTLFLEEDEAARVFVIEQGCMKSYKSIADGRRQIISFAFGGDLLGWVSSAGRYTSSVEALEPTMVLSFSRAELDKLRRVDHGIETELAGLTSIELRKAQEHILLLGRRTADERLACFMAGLVKHGALADSGDALIELPMSQEEIADYLGLRPETVNRALSRLRRQGIVKYENFRARSTSCSLGRLVDVDATVPI